MILQPLLLTRWEWYKLRRRWMPWVLLALVLFITQISLWGTFAAYVSGDSGDTRFSFATRDESGSEIIVMYSCSDLEGGRIPPSVERLSGNTKLRVLERVESHRNQCADTSDDVSELRQLFAIPSSIANSIGISFSVGIFLIMVLASSVMGVEYSWGTLRAVLTRGSGRWQLLASKLLLFELAGIAGFLVAAVLVAVSSLIAVPLAGDGGGLVNTGDWSTVAIVLGKAAYGIFPYAVLATFLTVLTTSAGVGVSIAIGYYVGEFILMTILLAFFDWADHLVGYVLGPNVIGWMTVEEALTTGDGALLRVGDPPGVLHAFFVLLVYVVVMGAVTFWIFQRKDVAGAKGE